MIGFLCIIAVFIVAAVLRFLTAVAGSRASVSSLADKGGVAFTAFSACTAILASGISGALQRKRPVVILLSVQLYLLADRGGILVEQPGDRSLIGIIDDAFLDDLPIGKAEVLVVRHSFLLS